MRCLNIRFKYLRIFCFYTPLHWYICAVVFGKMTNNDILKKLRVALKLRDTDIVHILSLVDFRISKSEVGALFRAEDHPKFVLCGDQILRNFLNGLVIYYRGNETPSASKPVAEI